jgi:hypothetical protein
LGEAVAKQLPHPFADDFEVSADAQALTHDVVELVVRVVAEQNTFVDAFLAREHDPVV